MKTRLIVLIVCVAIVAAYVYFGAERDDTNLAPSVSYKNATFVIEGKEVALSGGYAEEAVSGSSAKIITRYFGNEVRTDLDGDGTEDIAFLLTQQRGGSGIFFYVVAALAREGGYVGSDGYLLGDRIAPQTTEVSRNPRHKNVIVVNYADRAADDPMTAQPSAGKSAYLKIDAKTMQWGIVVPNFEGEVDMARVTVDLSGQGLTKVPEYVFARTDIETLDLSDNNLTGALQAEVRYLKNLRTLDLSGNKFTGVPAEIGQLEKLEVLDLSNNMLTGLPHELGNLRNLKTLDLSGNDYSELDLAEIKKKLPASTEIKTSTSTGGGQGIVPYKSGVRGAVTRGPMCPVVREGDNSCADAPYQTEVFIYRAGSSNVFATAQSGTDGTFQFNVPPGDYTLNAKNEGISKTCKSVSVSIGSDEMKSVSIPCDTGIR